MQNYSDYETERQLAELENKISAQYNDAYRELVKKCEEYFSKFDERYQKEYKAYQDGIYTKAQFDAWVKAQIARGKHWERLRENAALRITKANETAASYINDTTPSIWTLNYNYTAYQADKAMGVSFDIYDENTVRRLIVEEPNLLPAISQKAIDRAKDTAWNREQFTKDVTSGILQGKAPRELAKTIKHTMGLNQVSAIRNARTAITSAQNGGRMDGYNRLASLGVQMQKEWMATLDGRTRDSHRELDGERVPYDKPFSNGLQFPGDPQGQGREVWNCRCTMRAIFPENSEPRKMTYYGRNAESAYEEKDDESAFNEFVRRRIGKPRKKDIEENKALAAKKADMSKYKRSVRVGTYEEELEKVNPNYGKVGYDKNCQRCVACYEARLRGYNVTALPRPMRDALGSRNKEYGYSAVFENGVFEVCGGSTGDMAKIKIAVLMYGYGEGARAIVRIPRENKTGHVIMAINAGGGIMFVDPQTGKLAREGLWNEAIAENISAMRIDNKNFTGLITKCIEDI